MDGGGVRSRTSAYWIRRSFARPTSSSNRSGVLYESAHDVGHAVALKVVSEPILLVDVGRKLKSGSITCSFYGLL